MRSVGAVRVFAHSVASSSRSSSIYARATKATAVARTGDLEEASAIGESVFEIERQGIPEILR